MAGGGRQGGVNFPGCAQAVEQFVGDGIQLAAAVVRAIGQRALLAKAGGQNLVGAHPLGADPQHDNAYTHPGST